jgi:hypothetical protein
MNLDNKSSRSALLARLGGHFPWADGIASPALLAAVLTLAATLTYSVVAGAPFGATATSAMVMSGVVAASLGAMVASLSSQSPGQLFSPRASVCVLIATAAIRFGAPHAATPQALAHSVGMLTACIGVGLLLQAAFAKLRMGGVIRLIPPGVTDCIVIALAVKLVISQVRCIFSARTGDGLVTALAIAGVSIGAMAIAHRCGRKTLSAVVGLGAGTALAIALEQFSPSLEVAHMMAVNPAEGPLLSLRDAIAAMLTTAPAGWFDLAAFSLAIALVNSMETLTAVLRLEQQCGERIDADNALFASAMGSLASLCFGGLPVAGATTTSAVLVRHGAANRAAALSTAALVLAGALALGQALNRVPLAAVAALMLAVGLDLAIKPAKELVGRWRARRRSVDAERSIRHPASDTSDESHRARVGRAVCPVETRGGAAVGGPECPLPPMPTGGLLRADRVQGWVACGLCRLRDPLAVAGATPRRDVARIRVPLAAAVERRRHSSRAFDALIKASRIGGTAWPLTGRRRSANRPLRSRFDHSIRAIVIATLSKTLKPGIGSARRLRAAVILFTHACQTPRSAQLGTTPAWVLCA